MKNAYDDTWEVAVESSQWQLLREVHWCVACMRSVEAMGSRRMVTIAAAGVRVSALVVEHARGYSWPRVVGPQCMYFRGIKHVVSTLSASGLHACVLHRLGRRRSAKADQKSEALCSPKPHTRE